MPTSIIVQALILVGLASCLLAMVKGGAAERIAGILIIANIAIGFIAANALPSSADFVFRLINDGFIAFAFLGVTLRYGSPWLGVAMLLYGAQFTLHSYYFVMDKTGPDWTHAVINNAIFASVIICLLIGTVVTWRRRVVRARAA